MNRHNMLKYFIIILLLVLPSLTCNNNPVKPDENNTKKQWQKITALEEVDIWDVKIFNDEIYVAGRDVNDKGIIYKSTDAINWQNINPAISDSLDRVVAAIDFYDGNLIAGFTGKPVYLVTPENVTPLTKPILTDIREMIVDKDNNILIGTILSYFNSYVVADSIYQIFDSLNTPSGTSGCFRQAGIVPISVSKFLKDINSSDILLSNYGGSYHFVTVFRNRIIDCFPTEGLSSIDKFHGCHDIIFINDTLFAAGKTSIKFLDQNVWKTYGDTLPKTPDSVLTIATSIAYDEIRKEIYAAANYIGVVKWINNSGWIKLNGGLQSFQGYYDFIPDITYFKEKLLLTYGTSKAYKSVSRGAFLYSLNK